MVSYTGTVASLRKNEWTNNHIYFGMGLIGTNFIDVIANMKEAENCLSSQS